jgi:hypothetical protein
MHKNKSYYIVFIFTAILAPKSFLSTPLLHQLEREVICPFLYPSIADSKSDLRRTSQNFLPNCCSVGSEELNNSTAFLFFSG